MVLKFKCKGCREYIITKFLKIGEVAKCRNCGAETKVPETALEISEEPKKVIPSLNSSDLAPKVKGKIRSFWKIFGLGVITVGIYPIIYLFKTLNEFKNAYTFQANETNPDKVKSKLIVYVIIFTIIFIINLGLMTSSKATSRAEISNYILAKFYIWLLLGQIISVLLYIVFFSSYINLIWLCQKKRGITTLNKTGYFVIIGIIAALSFGYFFSRLLFYLNAVVGIILLYLIVQKVNEIWKLWDVTEISKQLHQD